ncbi:MAG: DegT/DnrJ/EryC1/StrS family aminotransferase [Methanobacterium formicicum]
MIPILEPDIGDEEIKNVTDAVKSGWVSSQGQFVKQFEHDFAKYHNTKFGLSTSNGTNALHLALKSIGIKKHDEVIVPSLTFVATANAVKYCNANPIFADSNPEYWCIDPEDVASKVNKRTKAIIPVHLFGHPCDMDFIMDIAEDNDLYVIEDAAQAHGSEYKGKKVGRFGDISCFSFFGNKTITTGEGGICITSNQDLADSMFLLRDHGMNPKKRYWHDDIGFNYRMTNLQAALGVAQLKKLDDFVSKKRQIANVYKSELKDLETEEKVILHPEMNWAKCNYWTFSILIRSGFKISRDDLISFLLKREIDSRPFFFPMHILPPYKNNLSLPCAETLSRIGISLPSSTKLDLEEVKIISENLKISTNET